MTLSFSQQFPDKSPTYFIEKIWNGIYDPEKYLSYKSQYKEKFIDGWYGNKAAQELPPKIHTIRADPKKRWRENMDIHFVINNRTKNRFQFAPVLPVKKIQTFELKYLSITQHPLDLKPMIWIDGYLFYDPALGRDCGIEQLAKNDGFESVEKFFEWFNDDFEGKIIHWTDFSYFSKLRRTSSAAANSC